KERKVDRRHPRMDRRDPRADRRDPKADRRDPKAVRRDPKAVRRDPKADRTGIRPLGVRLGHGGGKKSGPKRKGHRVNRGSKGRNFKLLPGSPSPGRAAKEA